MNLNLIPCLVSLALAAGAASAQVLPEALPFQSARSLDQWRDTVVGPIEPTPEGIAPSQSLAQYLVDRVDEYAAHWQERFESLTTHEAIAAYQSGLREQFIAAIGGLPQRTPLNPQITGTLQRPGYRVEKVLFQSLPGFYVTGVLFLPESPEYEAPYPGVLVPCGHYTEAKAWREYQSMGALLALSGMAAFVFDPIEQGERRQVLGSGVHNVDGHNALGPGSIVLGRNTTWFYLWDAIRALDYLQSRPEVDGARLGCTGNSGGGTQTLFLTAIDDRITAAAPSCSMSRMASKARRSPGDVEQHVFNQLVFGLDEPDYLMMRAPDVAWFLCTATQDFVDIQSAWLSFRYAKRFYTRLGFPERLNVLEEDVPHSYGKTQREAVARWMALWLRDEHNTIVEPELKLFTTDELQVTPDGDVMRLDGARNAYDINAAYADELKLARENLRKESSPEILRERIREATGIRNLSDLPPPGVEEVGEAIDRSKSLVFQPEKGIYLPAILFTPSGSRTGQALYLSESGKSSAIDVGAINASLTSGQTVLVADIRGTGETATGSEQQDAYNYFRASDLGRSLLAMRAEDILSLARYLRESVVVGSPIALVAEGAVGVAALHAAALEPHLFKSVTLRNTLQSYDLLARTPVPEAQWNTIVHGALKTYDLIDLAALLGDSLTIENPMGANARPLSDPEPHLGANLLHQWRFDTAQEGVTPDDVGDADALLRGAALIREGAADLTSNRNTADETAPGAAWIELPIADTLANSTLGLTIEAWITEGEVHNQAKLWSFGSTVGDELYLWPEYGNGYSHVVAGIVTEPNAPWRNAYTIVPLEPGQPHHLVVTLYGDQWTRELRLYIDGECVNVLKRPDMPNAIEGDPLCFLGRHCTLNNLSFPMWNGRIHEFRLYDGALQYDLIRQNYFSGFEGEPVAAGRNLNVKTMKEARQWSVSE